MISATIVGPSLEEALEQLQAVEGKADIVELRHDLWDAPHELPISLAAIIKTSGSERTIDQFGEKKICSYHNFTETPQDLDALFQDVQKQPADYYKIAVMAKSTLDALRLMVWAKEKKNVIPVSMGSYGQISRILSQTITYAAVDDKRIAAPGQLSIDTLLATYNFKKTSKNRAIFGLIGNPVSQSISHISHNQLGLDAVYVKMELKPEEIAQFLQLAKQMPFQGLSVTIPLKEAVMNHLDVIDPHAKKLGAVNTLHLVDGKWHGYNTDGPGCMDVLGDVAEKNIVILGAGGAAKAIAVEAFNRNAKLFIVNRDQNKAAILAEKVQGEAFMPKEYDILINCTPSLMPIDEAAIVPGSTVMDIHTIPKETDLLIAAKSKGCKRIFGYQMFIEQAARQYAIWLKQDLRDALKVAVEKALK